MRFVCYTTFDITATGVVGHYKNTKIPFNDRTGQLITDVTSWNNSRNQQRNWETLTQLISLRTQIFDLTDPIKSSNKWSFEFEVETPGIFGSDEDPVAVLKTDAEGTPMIDITNTQSESLIVLVTSGAEQNIWFEPIKINN